MYADRVESGGGRRSVKERLNGNTMSDSTRPQRQIIGKRQRQDDKWEHDLFDDDDDEPQITNRKVTAQDLRLKLQRKGLQPATQSGRSTVPNVRDLRERLSGTMNPQPKSSDPPKSKVVAKPSSKVGVEAPTVQNKRPANVPKKLKLPQKADISVDEFLQSLGLEKYLITFQAEEVDMAALNHMTDEDLKAMGIPMGPRKKILLAIESKV